MNKILFVFASALLSILLLVSPKQTNAASVYYTFTGPITNVVIGPEFSPPWEWFFSEPTYFESGVYGFIKPQNYGSITHTIEVDMSKAGTWTDGKVINGRLIDELPTYYANYIFGSLTNDSNPNESNSNNNYIVYYEDLNNYLEICVSWYDKFITLSNWSIEAAPDPGFGFGLNQAFLIRDGDWVLLTKISNINPVPEPTTLFLLAFGLIGAIGLQRKMQ